MNSCEQGFRNMAARLDNAEDNFIKTLQSRVSISKADAKQVLGYYVKHRLVKRDLVNCTYTVKHGSFLEPDVILRAVRLAAIGA